MQPYHVDLCKECGSRPIRYTGKGLCHACNMKELRASKDKTPNGNICKCGCGQPCYHGKDQWAHGHLAAITSCLCGCGKPVGPTSVYVFGHQPRSKRPQFKGVSLSPEIRKKMSDSHRGKSPTRQHRLALSLSQRKAGASKREEKARIRKGFEYREWRTAVFARDEYRCQSCGARNGEGKAVQLEAHHVKTFAGSEDLRFDVTNGVTLCRNCHLKTDSWGVRLSAGAGGQDGS